MAKKNIHLRPSRSREHHEDADVEPHRDQVPAFDLGHDRIAVEPRQSRGRNEG
jgi:hypothetical protein